MKGTVDVELLVPATTAALEGYRAEALLESLAEALGRPAPPQPAQEAPDV